MYGCTKSMFNDQEGNFCGHKFVRYLWEKQAENITYNDSNKDLESKMSLPQYYDEKKIKKAQQFFDENIMSMMTVSIAGLMTLLSNPRDIKLLIATNKSSKPISAYNRYKSTLFHVETWYRGEFKPGSNLWKSLLIVRRMHNNAVKLGRKHNIRGIDQVQLSITLFGFCGYALIRPHRYGLINVTNDDLEALAHFWRVIGYLMGVDDNLNICRESLYETQAICEALTEHFTRLLAEKHHQSIILQFAALHGSYLVMLPVKPKILMNFIYDSISGNNKNADHYYPMNLQEQIQLVAFKTGLELLRYKFIRKFTNMQVDYMLYLMKMYPEIVEYSFRGTDVLSLI